MKACRSSADCMLAGVIIHPALWYLMPKAPPAFESAVLQPWKKVG